VPAIRDANLAVKFALELVAIAAFAWWGASLDGVFVGVVVGIAAPAAAVVLWGRFAAPRSKHRLRTRWRVPFELGVFALAAAAIVAVGSTAVAIVFTAAVIINAALLSWLGQWER
jgi:hypothetical protein